VVPERGSGTAAETPKRLRRGERGGKVNAAHVGSIYPHKIHLLLIIT